MKLENILLPVGILASSGGDLRFAAYAPCFANAAALRYRIFRRRVLLLLFASWYLTCFLWDGPKSPSKLCKLDAHQLSTLQASEIGAPNERGEALVSFLYRSTDIYPSEVAQNIQVEDIAPMKVGAIALS